VQDPGRTRARLWTGACFRLHAPLRRPRGRPARLDHDPLLPLRRAGDPRRRGRAANANGCFPRGQAHRTDRLRSHRADRSPRPGADGHEHRPRNVEAERSAPRAAGARGQRLVRHPRRRIRPQPARPSAAVPRLVPPHAGVGPKNPTDPGANFQSKHDVGVGLHVLFPQVTRSVLRIDVGVPISASPLPANVPPVSFYVTFGQALSLPGANPPGASLPQ